MRGFAKLFGRPKYADLYADLAPPLLSTGIAGSNARVDSGMPLITLRSLVGAIGLTVAIAVTVAIPGTYLMIAHNRATTAISVVAGVQSRQLSKFASEHQNSWQTERDQLTELLEPATVDTGSIRQRVYAADGNLVTERGGPLKGPVLVRSSPILPRGFPGGRLEVATSLENELYNTSIVAAVGLILGAVTYLAMRVFPLNILHSTFDALETLENRLQTYLNQRFDVALSAVSQGLCVFDETGGLIAFNRRFIDMFKIPPRASIAGLSRTQVLAAGDPGARIAKTEPNHVLAKLTALENGLEPGAATFTRVDGHVISVTHQPMTGGGWVQTFEDVTEQRRVEAKLSYMAHHDMLTELPNRVSFYERLTDNLAQMTRESRLALLSLDLDNFKAVNDTLGHPAGDKLLQAVGERLRSCVRGGDLVARLGGDEFGVVQLDARDPNEATALVSRLIDSISAPYDLEGQQVVVGLSAGIALAPSDAMDPDGLIKNADLAMYRAKADGGNTYRFFEPEMDAQMRTRREVQLDLRKAILHQEFELYYQPLVNLETGRIASLEALIRWHHPTRGLIEPLDFVPIAEDAGLIIPIGQWVLRQACLDAVSWPEEISLAVNVSPVQFSRHDLVGDVTAALQGSGLPGSRLELEITELVLLEDNEASFEALHALHDLGVKIAMDDFGSGYSSIGYLRSFPFDKIKIDESFIRNITEKKDSLAIVRAVVGLGSSLGVATTAEGVETVEQLEYLRREGCTEVQGFLISEPMPVGEIGSMLSASVGPLVNTLPGE